VADVSDIYHIFILLLSFDASVREQFVTPATRLKQQICASNRSWARKNQPTRKFLVPPHLGVSLLASLSKSSNQTSCLTGTSPPSFAFSLSFWLLGDPVSRINYQPRTGSAAAYDCISISKVLMNYHHGYGAGIRQYATGPDVR